MFKLTIVALSALRVIAAAPQRLPGKGNDLRDVGGQLISVDDIVGVDSDGNTLVGGVASLSYLCESVSKIEGVYQVELADGGKASFKEVPGVKISVETVEEAEEEVEPEPEPAPVRGKKRKPAPEPEPEEDPDFEDDLEEEPAPVRGKKRKPAPEPEPELDDDLEADPEDDDGEGNDDLDAEEDLEEEEPAPVRGKKPKAKTAVFDEELDDGEGDDDLEEEPAPVRRGAKPAPAPVRAAKPAAKPAGKASRFDF
jgi:hypothetical protein